MFENSDEVWEGVVGIYFPDYQKINFKDPASALQKRWMLLAVFQTVIYFLIQVNFYSKEFPESRTTVLIFEKIDIVFQGKKQLKKVWFVLIRLSYLFINVILTYLAIRMFLIENSLLNFVFLGLLFYMAFRNSQNFKGFFGLIILYQSSRFVLLFVY